jgi:hypothetical protein
MFELGPYPRSVLRRNTLPEDVFRRGIPGLNEATSTREQWLGGFTSQGWEIDGLDSAFDAEIQVIDIETWTELCDQEFSLSDVDATEYTSKAGAVTARIVCPARIARNERKPWFDEAERVLRNALLDGLAALNTDAVAAVAPAEGAIARADSVRSVDYGYAGVVGIPTGVASLTGQNILEYTPDSIFTPAGHRVWLRPGGYGASGLEGSILASGPIFYETATDRPDVIFDEEINTSEIVVTIYGVIATDGPIIEIPLGA